jgi:hypothetical protein
MSVADLSPSEQLVVRTCLECVCEGELIQHDWEFETLFGLTPIDVREVLKAWPAVNEEDERVQLAVCNSLNSLAGLVGETELRGRLAFGASEIRAILAKWKIKSA